MCFGINDLGRCLFLFAFDSRCSFVAVISNVRHAKKKIIDQSRLPSRTGTTMLESMWSSMSSSMQLAQECLERNEDEEVATAATSSGMDGLEKFAQTIDNSELRLISRCSMSFQIRFAFSFEPHQGEIHQHRSQARICPAGL